MKFVSSKIKECDYSVDRKTVLGNPFFMHSEEQRNDVCDRFETYFEEKILKNDVAIISELRKIKELAKDKPTFKLGCHCNPRRCHADTIAYFLNYYSDSI